MHMTEKSMHQPNNKRTKPRETLMPGLEAKMSTTDLIAEIRKASPNGYFHILTNHGCVVLSPDNDPILIAMTAADAARAKTIGAKASIAQATAMTMTYFP